jgi:hypothetical protein
LPLGLHAVASSRKSTVAKARLTAMLDASVVRMIAVSPWSRSPAGSPGRHGPSLNGPVDRQREPALTSKEHDPENSPSFHCFRSRSDERILEHTRAFGKAASGR